jgi:hypothetical protein
LGYGNDDFVAPTTTEIGGCPATVYGLEILRKCQASVVLGSSDASADCEALSTLSIDSSPYDILTAKARLAMSTNREKIKTE